MTHDELLALINDEVEVCEPECNKHKLSNAPWLALRAVVELHKPQEITLPNGEWGANCVKCDGYDYPCETIQAIEKELD